MTSSVAPLYATGVLLSSAFDALLLAMLLSYPDGRLRSGRERLAVAVAGVAAIGVPAFCVPRRSATAALLHQRVSRGARSVLLGRHVECGVDRAPVRCRRRGDRGAGDPRAPLPVSLGCRTPAARRSRASRSGRRRGLPDERRPERTRAREPRRAQRAVHALGPAAPGLRAARARSLGPRPSERGRARRCGVGTSNSCRPISRVCSTTRRCVSAAAAIPLRPVLSRSFTMGCRWAGSSTTPPWPPSRSY